jgi:hypothetical protein
MKKLIILSILFLFPYSVSADVGKVSGVSDTSVNTVESVAYGNISKIAGGTFAPCVDPLVSAGPPKDYLCTGFLVCQNFEGTGTSGEIVAGYDNTETWTEYVPDGTVDQDDTTATILRGDNQLKMVGTTNVPNTYTTITESGTIYFHFLFLAPDATPVSNTNIFSLRNGTTQVAYVVLTTTGRLYISDGTATATTADVPSGKMSNATKYHVWGSYSKSTGGNNGVYTIEFTPETTYAPTGTGNAYATTGAAGVKTDDINRIYIVKNQAETHYYDQVLVKTSAIGTVCP